MNKFLATILVLVSSNSAMFVNPNNAEAKTPKVTPCDVMRNPIEGKQFKFLNERLLKGKKYTYRIFTYQITEAHKKYYEYVVVNGEQVTALATITPTNTIINGKQKTILDLQTCGLAGVGVSEAPTIKTSFSNRINTIYGKGSDKFTSNGIVGFSTKFGILQIGDRDI
jgi:hypothetical protein